MEGKETQSSTICILGIHGIGKTTLGHNLVGSDPRVGHKLYKPYENATLLGTKSKI